MFDRFSPMISNTSLSTRSSLFSFFAYLVCFLFLISSFCTGFILGEDPKSWPPPMKITREMVMAMGGDNSQHYYKFRNLACEAYTLLRRKSNIIIILFGLMLRAGIAIGANKVFESSNDLYLVQSKYSLDQSEEDAIDMIQVLIHKSVAALMPRLIEEVHTWAQYWRN